MTAQELIDLLSELDPNKEILIYDGAFDTNKSITQLEVDLDGDVVIS